MGFLIFAASLFGFAPAPGLEVAYVDGTGMKVRFLGIDTPEIRGQCEEETRLALEARDFVRELLEGAEEIRLRGISRGKFFRLLARPFVRRDGRWVDVVQAVLDAGLGRPYGGGTRQPWCPAPSS